MVSLCKPDKCALSFEWKGVSTETEHEHTEKAKAVISVHRPRFCCLCGNSFIWTQGWVTGGNGTLGHRHTQTQQFLGRSCSGVLWRVVVGPPLAGRRRPRGALVNRGLWLVTHPGKPKALRWSQNIFGLSTNYRYYGSPFLSWKSQTKGTFMLECRRFTNS